MSQMRLDNLVSALASSVAEAEHHIRVQQIRNIHAFFGDDNQPVSVELKLPQPSPEEPLRNKLVKVPIITLVNLSHMSISELEIKFSTSLGDVKNSAPADTGGAVAFAAETPAERDEHARRDLGWAEQEPVFIDVSSGPTTTESGTASVTLRVKQGETPEGLARILNLLNRVI